MILFNTSNNYAGNSRDNRSEAKLDDQREVKTNNLLRHNEIN